LERLCFVQHPARFLGHLQGKQGVLNGTLGAAPLPDRRSNHERFIDGDA
jgi:hypothetical protein